jgi:hypothetical protein
MHEATHYDFMRVVRKWDDGIKETELGNWEFPHVHEDADSVRVVFIRRLRIEDQGEVEGEDGEDLLRWGTKVHSDDGDREVGHGFLLLELMVRLAGNYATSVTDASWSGKAGGVVVVV